MPRPRQPHLRLVISNSLDSESATPRRRAKRKTSKERALGIPRCGQYATARLPQGGSRSPASRSGPPNCSISDAISEFIPHTMGTNGSIVKRLEFLRPGDSPKRTCPAGEVMVFDEQTGLSLDQKNSWDEAVMRRLEGLLALMGWEPIQLGQGLFPDKAKGESGPKSVKRWFDKDRRSVTSYNLWGVSQLLGVDLKYLMLVTDNLEAAVQRRGLFNVIRMERQLNAEKASMEISSESRRKSAR